MCEGCILIIALWPVDTLLLIGISADIFRFATFVNMSYTMKNKVGN